MIRRSRRHETVTCKLHAAAILAVSREKLGFSLPVQTLSVIFRSPRMPTGPRCGLKKVFYSGLLSVARLIPSQFADLEILRGHEAGRH
jgi:hypothetical protein